MNGRGCKLCGFVLRTKNISLTQEEFIEKANKVHNNIYDYSLVKYTNSHTNVIIVCKKHGEFEQEPTNHLSGQCCPTCSTSSISKKEQNWLDSLGVSNRQFSIYVTGKRYKVDGFDPSTNTAYEFNGDFWYGNPKMYKQTDINPVMNVTYGELYKRTLNKESQLKLAGYNVISI